MIGAIIDAASDFGQMAWSQYLNKKNMRDQAGLQYEYASRYARNSPSWNIEGLRNAGLNPILAVSNGVNLGANIPNISNNSPSGGGRGTKFTEALNNMRQNDIASRNASASEVTADANARTSEANVLRAKADATLKQAQTAETLQRTLRVNSSKYSSPVVRDVMGLIDDVKNQSKDLIEDVSSYLQHSPNNLPRGTSTNVRHAAEREKEYNRILDSEWKTGKTIEDMPVYRKRGDIGGNMPIYR